MGNSLPLPRGYRTRGVHFKTRSLLSKWGDRGRVRVRIQCIDDRAGQYDSSPTSEEDKYRYNVAAPWWNGKTSPVGCQRDVKTSRVLGNGDPCHGIPRRTHGQTFTHSQHHIHETFDSNQPAWQNFYWCHNTSKCHWTALEYLCYSYIPIYFLTKCISLLKNLHYLYSCWLEIKVSIYETVTVYLLQIFISLDLIFTGYVQFKRKLKKTLFAQDMLLLYRIIWPMTNKRKVQFRIIYGTH